MGRWSYLDTDEERLPEGIRRTGYDADTQTYTYTDRQGRIYEGVPGARYGTLRLVNNQPRRAAPAPRVQVAPEPAATVLHDYRRDDDDDKTAASDSDNDSATLAGIDEDEEKRAHIDEEKRSSNTTFESILGPGSPSLDNSEKQPTFLKRWSSVSKAAGRFIPKLGTVGAAAAADGNEKPALRTRAATFSPQMMKSQSEKTTEKGDDDAVGGGGGKPGMLKRASTMMDKPLPQLPRQAHTSSQLPRRRATVSKFTREAAQGVKQMFSDDSEYRNRRAR